VIVEYRTSFTLPAEFGPRDVTSEVRGWLAASGIRRGLVALQLVGSTGALTTIEYEPGALADLRRAVETLAPADDEYEHNARWHDGNGFSHVRSALLRTDMTIPVGDGEPRLGTWQQIVALNFDNRARRRELVGLIVGE
jgi:secondary thiamine-phosphate synthase enzyme